MTEKVTITLTTFVKFAVATTPGKRMSVVDEAKSYYGEDYDPAKDYWGPLRKGIVKMHENGSDRSELDALVGSVQDQKKLVNYRPCVSSYRRWMGRRRFVWVGGPGGRWVHDDLVVKVNPELVMLVNGIPHAIKLHFGEEVSKRRVDTMLYLVEASLARTSELTPAIMDVRRGRLVAKTREVARIEPFLRSEAAAFLQLWRSL